jgi:pimeloyl-ACP methyl ester carboxylesterase
MRLFVLGSMAGIAFVSALRLGAAAQPDARSPMVDHLAEETIKLETATGTIVGTLALPAGQGPFTVALVIAGSGPTDRNGNSPLLAAPNNSLKYLAEGLTAKGIATVRYDKRGVGESVSAARSEAELRFDHYVDDAADWVRLLRKDRRFGRAAIVGHSEGALIGMLAAEASRADAMVSIAGAGRPAHQALRDQIGPRLPPDLMKESDRIIDLILAGKTTDSVPAALMALYRPASSPTWFRTSSRTRPASSGGSRCRC